MSKFVTPNWDHRLIIGQIKALDQKKIIEGISELRFRYKDAIRSEVERELGERVKLIEDLYQEVVLYLGVLRDKGLVTREEIQDKLEALKR